MLCLPKVDRLEVLTIGIKKTQKSQESFATNSHFIVIYLFVFQICEFRLCSIACQSKNIPIWEHLR